ncbi:MAG: tetratricopeptide repeat protein [Planctomycetaceae bacterium]
MRTQFNVLTRLCAMLILLTPLSQPLFANDDDAPNKPAATRKEANEPLPYQRVLSEAESKQVAELTESSDKAIQNQQFANAERLAGEIVALRKKSQGETHWETIDARQLVRDIQILSRLTLADRQAYFVAFGDFIAAQKLLLGQNFAEAQAKFTTVRQTRQRLLGEDHPDVARCDMNLGMCSTWLKDFPAAQKRHEQALKSLSKQLGEDHPNVATCCSDLAFCFAQQGRADDAQPYWERHFVIARRIYGDKHDYTAGACLALAYNLDRPGHQAEATDYFVAAIDFTAQVHGAANSRVADRYRDLARHLESQDRHADARPQFEQALAIFRQADGEAAPKTIRAARELADHHRFYGSLVTARETLETALAARKKFNPAEDEDLADLHFDLGEVLIQSKVSHDAAPHLRRAYDLRRRQLGDKHVRVAKAAKSLGEVLLELGQHAEAGTLLESALKVFRDEKGVSNQEVPLILLDLAKNDKAADRPDQAQVHYEQALNAARELFGETGAKTLLFYTSLQMHLREQRKYAESEAILNRLLKIVNESPEVDDFDRASLFGTMSFEERRRGGYAAALPYSRESLRYWQRVAAQTEGPLAQLLRQQGGAGRYVRSAKGSVYSCLNGLGRYGEAGALQRRILAEDLEAYGPISDEVSQDYAFLSGLSLSHGGFAESEQFARQWLSVSNQLGSSASFPAQQAADALAISLTRQGKADEAKSWYQMAVGAHEKSNGPAVKPTINGALTQGQIRLRLGELDEAETLFRQAVQLADGPEGVDLPFLRPVTFSALATVLREQRRYDEARPFFEKARDEQKKLSGETHPSYVTALVEAAANHYAAGDESGSEKLLSEVARLYPQVRLQVDVGGLDRAAFAAAHVPLDWLAALQAKRGAHREARTTLEEFLGRGLLDDLSVKQSRPLTLTESQHEADLNEERRAIDERIGLLTAAQAKRPDDPSLERSLEVFTRRRQRLLGEWTELQAEFVQRYGPAAGEIFSLERIQSQLKPDEALVAWVDCEPPAYASPRPGMHFACVVRKSGDPQWVRLPGTGPKDSWTADDLELTTQLSLGLTDINTPPNFTDTLIDELRQQRIAPLESALAKVGDLPAVRHVVVLGSSAVPMELLTDPRTVSYAPSGTVFALLRERQVARDRDPARSSGLLAIGDPVLPVIAEPPSLPNVTPPDSGVLVFNVLKDSTGEAAKIRSGDIVLSYAGVAVKSVNELVGEIQKRAANLSADQLARADTPIELWRDGEQRTVQARRGRLGVVLSQAAANVAWRELRRGRELVTLAQRGEDLQPLPSSRRETLAIARLFTNQKSNATTWLGSQATEQQLESWRRDGRLGKVRYLHFATHALLNRTAAMESALVLSEPPNSAKLSDSGSDEFLSDGRITAGQILREWKLKTDLVVLSACETGLGQSLGGEGTLGFSQAFLLAGTQSLVVSLWRVEDNATALLMQRFYQNLLGSRPDQPRPLSKANALREAKRWLQQLSAEDAERLLNELEPEAPNATRRLPPGEHPFEHPYFWSAFILIGDPQ